MKKALLVILILILIIAGWVLKLVWDAGQFKSLEPHFAGNCRQIPGVVGPEDITIHPETGIAYISSSDRRAAAKGMPAAGAIYSYNTNLEAAKAELLTRGPGKDFGPHGISLLVSETGNDYLFVVNHVENRHSIEVFELVDNELEHRKTYLDPLLVSPNDIVAVAADKFYVTNDHGYPGGIKQKLEDYLKLARSGIVYFDGNRFANAASGYRYANGINISPDGKTVYMAATTGKSVVVFDRNPVSGDLTETFSIDMNTGVDNIELDLEGNLWIASHPKLLSFVAHVGDPKKKSPSQVLRVSVAGKQDSEFKEVYLNMGEELSGSSVAAVRGNRMFVGAVFDPFILDCTLK